ncbi:MAG: Gfo/Idh/MocA family oxidoreductase, partial [Thermoanaerobaculia bacterium]|nr:Gfo/Idh/MocA family oxidoreductase [Thermoanaerobaculia bacterium]
MPRRLGIGFVGSGFMARFHIRSFVAVRDADLLGFWSPSAEGREAAAATARELGVGEARAFASIADMVADDRIDALWLCGPNHARVENLEAIVAALREGRGSLVGVACEKPLGRNVAEARRMVALAREAELLDGYLENQVFAPAVVRGRELLWQRGARSAGRPYLARAAEEHSGPHNAWFWRGELQGGGVLNDMMCHSIEVARFLVTDPELGRSSLTPRRVTAQIASLKWGREAYAADLAARFGPEVDYRHRPAEDFARVFVEYQDGDGEPVVVEATTSWSFVGAGLRLSMEVLGPEYSMQASSLDTELTLFFSRHRSQEAGEDLVEKQNAETGLMPVIPNECAAYGYEEENRHMVRSFLAGERPRETFDDGLDVTRLLMAAYHSAELGRTVDFPPPDLDSFVPAVAAGSWQPRNKPGAGDV